MSNPSIAADKTPWYQWDTGLTVTVSGGEMTECHFANRKQGTAYVQAVINGVARVPDELLQVAAPIKVYGYVYDDAGGQTYVDKTFEVIARNIPSDYTYTKTAQKTIRDAEAARDQAVQAAKDAKGSALAADDSAVEASNSAQSAGESASTAATSASNAAKSAGEAAKSASDAKAAASKTVEDASELLKTYTDNAKTSADNAATSASNAATSASNAASSATAAAKSASDAAASVSAINVIAPKKVNKAAVSSESSIAAGSAAVTNSNNSVAIGRRASTTKNANNSIAIGQDAVASEDASVCIGINATAKHVNSVAIGANSTTSKSREFSVGKPATGSTSEVVREITNVSTPTANTSASTKKYTDDNDAKTLSEAKKYTDENTSNALVGNVSGKLLHVEDAWPGKLHGLTIDGAYKQDGTPSPENPVPITVIENPVLKVTGADTSAAGTSLPITLPAEHPYLAALPNGTHDEIVIDKDGNASLVARVGKTETAATDGVNATVGTDALSSTGALADGATVYYKLATPVTYNLGKLDIPSLPETISNVWTDSELATNMSMTYKRDINIAFGNLVQAVVAAAAGE